MAELSPINVGDVLPSYKLKNEKDEDVDIATLTQDKGIVLFAVPKADTPGCTTQACAFRDNYPDFTKYNFEVYCISHDSPAAQTRWQTKPPGDRARQKELPYPLLSDPNRVLIAALGAKNDAGNTTRSHFIFEKGGRLVDRKLPVTPKDSTDLALESVKAIAAKDYEIAR
ncbi:thioredoxin-like protein [Vararia minispora EC-137]|uniref:Thioredoxin-like protein n=1 Tax=Vararia minispora EC-137 TaxID=1314806 RepID=A0ACB8QZ52_9AGAM|nr:thioredoxin-like protein [Vararia minispora EC-137]